MKFRYIAAYLVEGLQSPPNDPLLLFSDAEKERRFSCRVTLMKVCKNWRAASAAIEHDVKQSSGDPPVVAGTQSTL
jgi:hypothetical protein